MGKNEEERGRTRGIEREQRGTIEERGGREEREVGKDGGVEEDGENGKEKGAPDRQTPNTYNAILLYNYN